MHEINMFADNIALYRIITTPKDYEMLQEDVSAISSFLDNKHLNFNEDKCYIRKRSNCLSPPPYLNATELVQVNSYKYLGVIITNTLSWQSHIILCKKDDIQKPVSTLQPKHTFEIISDYHQTSLGIRVPGMESLSQGRN